MEVGADLRGYNSVLGFWDPRRMCVFNFRVLDIYADTYVGTQLHTFLAQYEQRNKYKYLDACIEQR